MCFLEDSGQKNAFGQFCSRRKAANFCHPVIMSGLDRSKCFLVHISKQAQQMQIFFWSGWQLGWLRWWTSIQICNSSDKFWRRVYWPDHWGRCSSLHQLFIQIFASLHHHHCNHHHPQVIFMIEGLRRSTLHVEPHSLLYPCSFCLLRPYCQAWSLQVDYNKLKLENIAKGITDPRVEFTSQVLTQILIKIHFQNLNGA